MLTLGVHDGHTATACLFEDGNVIACISEERLNRVKEWAGFPEGAIRKCLEITGKAPAEVDAIGVCGLLPNSGVEHYFRPSWPKRAFGCAAAIVPRRLLQNSRNVGPVQALGARLSRSRTRAVRQKLADMGFAAEKVSFFEHHLLHAATAYYLNWFKPRKTLVITLDGSGDGVCATVNVGERGRIRRIAQVFNYNSICDFYTRVTQYLGMRPMSHEYKVMGMAPYAPAKDREPVLELFRTYFRLSEKEPLQFLNTSGRWKWQFMSEFRDALLGKRFDLIAGAVQELFEERVLAWIRAAIRETGIGDLALSGGGFMNVKVNYLISKLEEVSSLFVFPGCGDESNPIGAAILSALGLGFPVDDIAPLGMTYWGTSFTIDEVERAIRQRLGAADVDIEKCDVINEKVAAKVAEGKIVGRFTGRMEWGARALGNRSILADPRNQSTIHKINKAIKMRDFWMPFAPAILREYRNVYLDLREDFKCPFMTIIADTKPRAWDDIPAGLHPFDKSSRAQVLDPQNHPSFYDLVSRFEKLTGVGGVLNTSFNLHGDPIVNTPEDAIDTFLRSDLDVLQLEDYVIEKRRGARRRDRRGRSTESAPVQGQSAGVAASEAEGGPPVAAFPSEQERETSPFRRS